MKKERPGFWAYLKSMYTLKTEVHSKDGKSYYFNDIVPKFVIAGVVIAVVLLALLINYAEFHTRLIVTSVLLGAVLLLYPIPVYLFTRFKEVHEEDNFLERLKKRDETED